VGVLGLVAESEVVRGGVCSMGWKLSRLLAVTGVDVSK
jgi:hypothetical protein